MYHNILQVQTPRQTCILTELLNSNQNPDSTLSQTVKFAELKDSET